MSKQEFVDLVGRHTCLTDILRELHFSPNSGTMAKIIKDRITYEKIDCSHFTGRKDVGGQPRYILDNILVEHSPYKSRERLKIRLINAKILDYKCVECGNSGTWKGKSLSLKLDHINGVPDDNRKENLRFLCPNCHSQTLTFSGRNRK